MVHRGKIYLCHLGHFDIFDLHFVLEWPWLWRNSFFLFEYIICFILVNSSLINNNIWTYQTMLGQTGLSDSIVVTSTYMLMKTIGVHTLQWTLKSISITPPMKVARIYAKNHSRQTRCMLPQVWDEHINCVLPKPHYQSVPTWLPDSSRLWSRGSVCLSRRELGIRRGRVGRVGIGREGTPTNYYM